MVRKSAASSAKKTKADELGTMRPAKAENVLSRLRDDGSVVIIRLDNDRFFFVLDSIAAEFWGMIDGRKSIETICSRLEKKHRPPNGAIAREAKRLIQDLRKHKLIRW